MSTTTKAAHTPGPWRVDNLAKVRSSFDDGKGLVADVGDGRYQARREMGVCEANAHLIAAAPETAAERDRLKKVNQEMLEALEKLANEASGFLAIAKEQSHVHGNTNIAVLGERIDLARAAIRHAKGEL